MIYTVTLNPSLDYVLSLNELRCGELNRISSASFYPGGKGINVSIMLSILGIQNKAFGFLAGFTGEEIEQRLKKLGIQTGFTFLTEGESRVNVKIEGNEETELNAKGPNISEAALENLCEMLRCPEQGDVVVLSGSIPGTVKNTVYEEILSIQQNGVLTVVDTHGDSLSNVLHYRPFLVKPNIHELGELFHRELKDIEEVTFYAEKIRCLGARNVLVSMGKEGALLLTEDEQVFVSEAPEGKLVNSVCAGDSMVAGFLAGYLLTKDYNRAFELSIAAGSATAFSEWLADRNAIKALLKNPSQFGF